VRGVLAAPCAPFALGPGRARLTRITATSTEAAVARIKSGDRVFIGWQPGSITLSPAPVVPDTLRSGRYDLLLALPDPAPSLHDRPDYAIRFANQGVWDAACGCNSLNAAVVITGRNPKDQ
jgi:hypothetical protein